MLPQAATVDVDDPDGRRLRRDRNRDAVVDALLELFREGNLQPSSAEIADRAGLSSRSLFRYFDDIDDLTRAAIQRQQARVWPMATIDIDAGAPLADRVRTFVDGRVRLYEAIGNVGRVARLREAFQPLVAEELARGRNVLRRQVRTTFAPELEALDGSRAGGVLATVDVLCSFESYLLLRVDHGLGRSKTAAALVDAVTALLTSLSPDPVSEEHSR